MSLHDFMLPEVIPNVPRLEDIAGSDLPSPIFVGFDPETNRSLSREGLLTFDDHESWTVRLETGYKGVRRKIFESGPLSVVSRTTYVDFEDSRYQPREVSFGRDFNVFQYNRRKGDRSSVLWRLRSYFEPSPSLGHPPKGYRGDELEYEDKLSRVFWRGGTNGSRWADPYNRVGPGAEDLAQLPNADWQSYFSRFNLVADSSLCDFVDAKFTGIQNSDSLRALKNSENYISDNVSPNDMLEYKYIICPAGNDVSSALYWIINSNSVPFRETVDFEVVPDYFLKPWVHYIPLLPGLADLREKFEYCESNPDLCKKINENGKIAYARMSNSGLWESAELTVLDRLGLIS